MADRQNTNPFEYGGVVGASAFCNREREVRDLEQAARNGDRMLVYAERRMGKTSLLKRVLDRLPEREFIAVYVDLWSAGDAGDVARLVARAVAEAAATRVDKVLETSKDLFRHLVPSVTVDESGAPVVQFGARGTGVEDEPLLEDAFDAPARLAAKRKRRVVVVYDEVQRLGEFGDDLAERVLRSRVQHHRDVGYVFMGSRKHLIQRMFLDPARPLYQAAGHYPIGPIATEHWVPFVQERFTRTGKTIAPAVVEALCALTGEHPYYTQHLAHALWEITPAGEEADERRLTEGVDLVLRRLSYPFSVLWENLASNQQTLLRGLAAEGPRARPFSSAFLKAHRLASSSAHRAAEALLERDVIDREGEGYVIGDRFFRLWVQRL